MKLISRFLTVITLAVSSAFAQGTYTIGTGGSVTVNADGTYKTDLGTSGTWSETGGSIKLDSGWVLFGAAGAAVGASGSCLPEGGTWKRTQ